MKTLLRYLIKQAVVIPSSLMLAPIIVGLLYPGYHSLSQHISELGVLVGPIAVFQRVAQVGAGFSILLFAVGVHLLVGKRLRFSTLSATVFGAALVSNGVFVMTSPWHDLHGFGGFFMLVVPVFYALELPAECKPGWFDFYSSLATILTLLYVANLAGHLEPAEWRGLTQRVVTVIVVGWYSVAAACFVPVRPLAHRAEPT